MMPKQSLLLLLIVFLIKSTSSFPSGDELTAQTCIICEVNTNSTEDEACTGTIKLTTENTVHAVSARDGDAMNKKYGMVETITVEGNCCWSVATKTRGRGRTTDFTQAVSDRNHQVSHKYKQVIIKLCIAGPLVNII